MKLEQLRGAGGASSTLRMVRDEKGAVLFLSAKTKEAHIHCEHKENLESGESEDQMFGNDEIQLNLVWFGVDTVSLRELAVQFVFCAWLEDWEQRAWFLNDCVAEARLLAKYKELIFHDPTIDSLFSICNKNMSFDLGDAIGNGWILITFEMACKLKFS